MNRTDFLDDPNAPHANSLVPASSAIITNQEGKILLQQRADSHVWALPGGTMQIGESIEENIIREVKEETGLDIIIEKLLGVYSNPNHVIAYDDGEVRQEFSVCFICRIVGGQLQISQESTNIGFFSRDEITHLQTHPSNLKRIQDYFQSEQP
jgi:ADP-ribose pyrophosphatase YjhB (NUDIX family)